MVEVELLPAPPRQENKQIPDTEQGHLCQNHQILLYLSSQLARSQHRERHKHSTQTPQGFSLLTLTTAPSSSRCWPSVALGNTFQACLGDQRDRRTGVYHPSSPSPVPCTPTCTAADLQSSSFTGFKNNHPHPAPEPAHTPTLTGTCRGHLGHFLPGTEDSHLLLELAARSAKQENLLLAHARHGIVPHVPHKSWWLWEPLMWDKQGRVALWTWDKVLEHSPYSRLVF